MKHLEFLHKDHFQQNYHRVEGATCLKGFVNFYWQTNFDELLFKYPQGFSDVLFPDIGYTYLINLGTPFTMTVAGKKYPIRSAGFLPRSKGLECRHQIGNSIFGIKLQVSPVLLNKQIDFSEYRDAIYPLAYLLDQEIIKKLKAANSFEERVVIMNSYYSEMLGENDSQATPVRIVSDILQLFDHQKWSARKIESLADTWGISVRTLHRYFTQVTGISPKKASQIHRIRKATGHLSTDPGSFEINNYGYFDYSHFYKHLKEFFKYSTVAKRDIHLQLLKNISLKT